jgi:DNA-3-methyladenine glycosylase
MGRPLPHHWFLRPAPEVALDLLGRHIEMPDGVVLCITETEAYTGDDTACHAHRGQTARNAPLFGPPGHLYVYLCYGIHHLLNLVTDATGTVGCVLVRGCTVVAGETLVRKRRGGRLDLRGPGKVGQALGLDGGWSGRALDDGPSRVGMAVLPGEPVPVHHTTPRIGIDYAEPADRDRLWRFVAGPVKRRRQPKARPK